MNRGGRVSAAIVLVAGIGCRPEVRPDPEPLVVAVQNLYVGTDLTELLSTESPERLLDAVARGYASIVEADFPGRASKIANAIAAERPHLVGLQEAAWLRRQSPGDLLAGGAVPAVETELDFLEILLGELEARGASYRPAARYSGMDIEVPLARSEAEADDIRLTDHGVILARHDVGIRAARSRPFETTLELSLGGEARFPVTLRNGWASVEATVEGRVIRFVTTHLESGDLAPDVQAGQIAELLSELRADTLPVVMVGDFSTTPDGRSTPTYGEVLAAGFADAWSEAAPGAAGPTCCQRADLRNESPVLDRRLDFVFFRGDVPGRERITVSRIGARPTDRTASGLWPSDHAGLVARFGARSDTSARP